MTLKDQFDVKGYDSTLGYVGRAFKPALRDCVLVAMLKQMGAIIIAKSNLPQSIMVCLDVSMHSFELTPAVV
jgi:amidase